MKTFSLAYTSCRKDCIANVVNEWISKAANPSDIEIVIAVDGISPGCINAAQLVPGAKVVIQAESPHNCVRGWNLAADHTSGKVIIAIADDFSPPQNWDQELLNLPVPNWIDGEWVVHTEDGYVHNIAVLSILTRKRFERYGYLFYPLYESMFTDTEFTEVAYRDGVVIQAKHLLFEHMHPDCRKRPRDNFDNNHSSKERWNRGEMLFNYRRASNFPVDEGPKAGQVEIVATASDPSERYAAYIQATKDDFCLYEVCKRLFDEGIRDFFFSVPSEYWSGRVTPVDEIAQVTAVQAQVIALGAQAQHKIFEISKYRFPGDTRLAVETRVRNDSLNWVRRQGFKHVLVVDGDELFPIGGLKMMQDHVREFKPEAISLPMIPVVGLPGYPIDRASDRAVTYMAATSSFFNCRTPATPAYFLNGLYVFHFTGTRRTMEEIIVKHRESGHYDDADYDFEGWIKNTLPNIKPGLKNVHMYKPHQIWPSIRNWTKNEYSSIPDSLRPYLARPVVQPDLQAKTPKVTDNASQRI